MKSPALAPPIESSVHGGVLELTDVSVSYGGVHAAARGRLDFDRKCYAIALDLLRDATGHDFRTTEAFVGTSAGSLVAAALVAGERPRRPQAGSVLSLRRQGSRDHADDDARDDREADGR